MNYVITGGTYVQAIADYNTALLLAATLLQDDGEKIERVVVANVQHFSCVIVLWSNKQVSIAAQEVGQQTGLFNVQDISCICHRIAHGGESAEQNGLGGVPGVTFNLS